jgi:hypothetical protein
MQNYSDFGQMKCVPKGNRFLMLLNGVEHQQKLETLFPLFCR